MATIDLSNREVVDAIAPGSRTIVYYDFRLAGFGLRVTPSGRKVWIAEYRPNGGGRKVGTSRMTIAPTSVMAPEKARNAAKDILAAARLGGDPAMARTKRREMPTVRQFSKVFMDDHVQEKKKPSTQVTYQDAFDRLINPLIGSLKIDCVTFADVTAMHLKIARTGKDGKRREGMANRALTPLSSMYSFAVRQRILPFGTNPVSGVERYPENFTARYLTHEEIGRIGAALSEGETVGIPWEAERATSKHAPKRDENRRTFINPFAAAALRLLISRALGRARSSRSNGSMSISNRRVLCLPDSKTGHKTIELNTAALFVLAGIPRMGPFVIAGVTDKHRCDLNGPGRAVRRRAGVRARLHDLRHTVASIGINAGLGLPIIGKLLGHTSSEATERYAHLADATVKRGSEMIGRILTTALSGSRRSNRASAANRRLRPFAGQF